MSIDVVIVSNGDDWEGLYVCGKCVAQGHKLTAEDILNVFSITYENKLTAEGWLENIGHLPENIEDVVFDE